MYISIKLWEAFVLNLYHNNPTSNNFIFNSVCCHFNISL